MALATIEFPPTDENSFFTWAQAHASHHADIIRRCFAVHGSTELDSYILDPFDPENMGSWLEQHQIMHIQMDKVLRIAGYDLSELYWDDPDSVGTWFAQHFVEHQIAGAQLQLG